jgi:hypothetical protein
MAWPPELALLKTDMGIAVEDTRDDVRLQMCLDAAVAVVERLREGDFTFSGTPTAELPAPGDDVELGTCRLAWRWHVRRRSPDALVAMGDLGTARVPAFDADVETLLGIGRHREPRVAG